MNQIDIQKCIEDPIYFAEKYLGLELSDYQALALHNYKLGKEMRWFGIRSGKRMTQDIIQKHMQFKEENK